MLQGRISYALSAGCACLFFLPEECLDNMIGAHTKNDSYAHQSLVLFFAYSSARVMGMLRSLMLVGSMPISRDSQYGSTNANDVALVEKPFTKMLTDVGSPDTNLNV